MTTRPTALPPDATTRLRPRRGGRDYFLLRRWTRVFFSSLRCFFLAIRLRRFLMTEPTGPLRLDGRADRLAGTQTPRAPPVAPEAPHLGPEPTVRPHGLAKWTVCAESASSGVTSSAGARCGGRGPRPPQRRGGGGGLPRGPGRAAIRQAVST